MEERRRKRGKEEEWNKVKEGREGSSKERETNLNDFKGGKMSPGRCY